MIPRRLLRSALNRVRRSDDHHHVIHDARPFVKLPKHRPDRLSGRNHRLPEESDLVWHDVHAPEMCIDFDASHVPSYTALRHLLLMLCVPGALFGLCYYRDVESFNEKSQLPYMSVYKFNPVIWDEEKERDLSGYMRYDAAIESEINPEPSYLEKPVYPIYLAEALANLPKKKKLSFEEWKELQHAEKDAAGEGEEKAEEE